MKQKSSEKLAAEATDLKNAPPAKQDRKTKEVKTDKVNVEASAQKIQYDRILKWLYPTDCTTAKDRKVFRAKNRGTIRRKEAHALKVGPATKEGLALIAEAKVIRKEVLVDPLVQV